MIKCKEGCICGSCIALWAKNLANDLMDAGEAERAALFKFVEAHNQINDEIHRLNQVIDDAKNACVTTLDQYQNLACRTSNMSLDEKLNLAVLALGFAGESGEVCDLIKKYAGHNHELDRQKLMKEIGDVVWYVAVLANALGFKLSEVAQANVDKLKKRYPNGFDSEASKNRKE